MLQTLAAIDRIHRGLQDKYTAACATEIGLSKLAVFRRAVVAMERVVDEASYKVFVTDPFTHETMTIRDAERHLAMLFNEYLIFQAGTEQDAKTAEDHFKQLQAAVTYARTTKVTIDVNPDWYAELEDLSHNQVTYGT